MNKKVAATLIVLATLLIGAPRWQPDAAPVSWHSTPRGFHSVHVSRGCLVLWFEWRPDLIRVELWPNRNKDAVPWAVGFDTLEGKPILQRRKPIKAQP